MSSMELDVAWNPVAVKNELQAATTILMERGLKLAAKWTVEQWMGLPVTLDNQDAANESNHHHPAAPSSADASQMFPDVAWRESSPHAYYAKTLMDLGEYGHAAAALSQPGASKDLVDRSSMPPPLPDLSPAAAYLRAYCLYMAGERRKDEDGQHVEQLLKQQRCVPMLHAWPQFTARWRGFLTLKLFLFRM
jgi:Anaphase promoting complex subunit 8 / Cdc23